LNEGLDAKAEADILRLTALASPDRIVYCSSQKLSEQRVDQITASLRRHSPNGSIVVYGAKQLGALADKDHETFENSYGAELQEIRSMVYSDHPSGDPGSGLRLALLTFGSSEGTDLRDEALRSILLDRLSLQNIQTVESICRPFSEDIGLQRTLPERYLIDALNRARDSGDVETLNGGWRLTVQGAEKQAALPLKGVEQILEGRHIVRAGIEKLTGKTFSNTQYKTIWSSLIDTISGMFHANGLEIIRGVDEILSGTSSKTKPLNLKSELENGMRSVVSSISTTDLRNQTYRALLDLFTEREGPVFDWLTRISERFVTLCALGLEHTSGEALRETLTAQKVVLDSDVILDFLCKAEADHEASRDLLINWLNIGGKILVSPIVLEEVAHNAWISDRDFRGTETLLGRLQNWELHRFIKNPFVRTFHFYKSPASKWQLFISQYRGNSPGDYSKILAILRLRLKVEVLPASFDEEISAQISAYLKKDPSTFEPDNEYLEDVVYKVERDGKLLASVAAARVLAESTGLEDPMVILSSSGALRSAELKFEGVFGQTRLVLNKRSFSYILASIPQVSLGADTLRRALFTFGSNGRLKSDGMRAMRLIRATDEVELPWAERFTLRQELSRCLKREADRRGITKKEMEKVFTSGSSPESSAKLIVEAIQELAVPTDTKKELEKAQKKIQELEIRLAEASRPQNPVPARSARRSEKEQ
jgi:hypothetical protein